MAAGTGSGALIVGLDAGTSAIKAVAFDLAGHEVASASRRNAYDIGADGAVTQPMARTFDDCAAVLRDLGAQIEGFAARVAALGVTGQGDGTWLLDGAGAPVGDGLLWLDVRAAAIVRTMTRTEADRARFAATGTGLTACQQGPQLRFLAERHPEAIARAATALHCKDYIHLRLTGVRATDPCEAAFSFGNFRTRDYDDAVIAALGLEPLRHLLPPVLDGAGTTHPLLPEAAVATGLRAGTPVALGYLDAACTALGAGVFEGGRGHGCTIVGSTGVHMKAVPAEAVVLTPEPTGYVLVLPVPGIVAQMQTNMAGTLNLDWILGVGAGLLRDLGLGEADLIGALDRWLDAAPPGGPLYQPYVSPAGERGPFVDPAARAGFVGLETRHGFAHLVRAVAEGMGHAARDCYGAMGGVPAEVRLTGGAARSGALTALWAAGLGARLRPSRRAEAGATGAAMIAATAVGAFGSMQDAIAGWVTPWLGAAVEPDPALAATLARRFEDHLAARRALGPVWARMAGGDGAADRGEGGGA
ncbi:MAG: FGGY family carbohydrate kinase [Gemmobacter sp.]